METLIQSHDTVLDIEAKTKGGLEFYEKLTDAVGVLQNRMTKLCRELKTERERILAEIEAKGGCMYSSGQS